MNANVRGAGGMRARTGGAGEEPREARGFEDLETEAAIGSCICNNFAFYLFVYRVEMELRDL